MSRRHNQGATLVALAAAVLVFGRHAPAAAALLVLGLAAWPRREARRR